MLYNKEEKQKLEEVISVLKEYIADNPFADLVWSEKLGYVYLCISFPQSRNMETA